jgi:hypothetical protein
MANTRTRLLQLLFNADQVLAEAETIAADLPVGGEQERQALSLLPELRKTVSRVERMLYHPDDHE